MNERARTWGLRLLALGLAIGIWFNASLEDRLELSERLVEASVSYNRPRSFVILNQISTVNVRLIGSKKVIRQLAPYQVNVQVELRHGEPGTYTINLTPDDVSVPQGLEVVAIEPNVIRVDLEREITQRIPVKPQLVGKPPDGLAMDPPEVYPNQVLVAGPESLVSRLQELRTRPVVVNGHSSTFETVVPVDTPDPLIQVVQPLEVTVHLSIHPPDLGAEGRQDAVPGPDAAGTPTPKDHARKAREDAP
jgi:YbbR domain-containing protein